MKPDAMVRRVDHGPQGASGHRVAASERFERALRSEPDDASGDGSGRDGAPRHRNALQGGAPPLPAEALQTVRRALGVRACPAQDPAESDLLGGLLNDIAEGLRAAARMPGNRWRLRVRLDPALLAASELEMACAHRELSVVLRTASEAAYHRLAETLPALNRALSRQGRGDHAVALFWVGRQELQ